MYPLIASWVNTSAIERFGILLPSTVSNVALDKSAGGKFVNWEPSPTKEPVNEEPVTDVNCPTDAEIFDVEKTDPVTITLPDDTISPFFTTNSFAIHYICFSLSKQKVFLHYINYIKSYDVLIVYVVESTDAATIALPLLIDIAKVNPDVSPISVVVNSL